MYIIFFLKSPISETDSIKQTLKEREEMTVSFTRREEESFDSSPFAISDFSSPVACLPSCPQVLFDNWCVLPLNLQIS